MVETMTMRQKEKNNNIDREAKAKQERIENRKLLSPFVLADEGEMAKAKASRHNLCRYTGCLLHLHISLLPPFGLHIHHVCTLLHPLVVLGVPFTLADSSLADAAEQKGESTDTHDGADAHNDTDPGAGRQIVPSLGES